MWADVNRAPKRANRFLLSAGNVPQAMFTIQKVTLPNFSIDEAKVNFVSSTFYYPGKIEWQPISMTLVDPLLPDMSERFIQIVNQAGYTFPGLNGIPAETTDPNTPYVSSFSKGAFTEAFGGLQIWQINSIGTVMSIWSLINPWIKSAKFGEQSMENSEILNIEIELRYDYATYRATDERRDIENW